MEPIVLPVKVTRAAQLRILAPLMLVMPFLVGVALAYVVTLGAQFPRFIPYGLPLFLLASNIGLLFVLCKQAKPALIEISHNSVTISPITILGFGGGPTYQRSMNEFDYVKVVKIRGRGGVIYKPTLHSKDGKSDLSFDPPQGVKAADFAQQLAAALNMKVENDA